MSEKLEKNETLDFLKESAIFNTRIEGRDLVIEIRVPNHFLSSPNDVFINTGYGKEFG